MIFLHFCDRYWPNSSRWVVRDAGISSPRPHSSSWRGRWASSWTNCRFAWRWDFDSYDWHPLMLLCSCPGLIDTLQRSHYNCSTVISTAYLVSSTPPTSRHWLFFIRLIILSVLRFSGVLYRLRFSSTRNAILAYRPVWAGRMRGHWWTVLERVLRRYHQWASHSIQMID